MSRRAAADEQPHAQPGPLAKGQIANRLAAWSARRAAAATGFVSQPEPRSIGLYARGKQLLHGNILLAGHLAEAPGTALWDITPPIRPLAPRRRALPGWTIWPPLAARPRARWRRTGPGTGSPAIPAGKGPGWTPDLTGRRIIRWIHHAIFLLQGRDKAAVRRLLSAPCRVRPPSCRAAGKPPPPACPGSRR